MLHMSSWLNVFSLLYIIYNSVDCIFIHMNTDVTKGWKKASPRVAGGYELPGVCVGNGTQPFARQSGAFNC